MSQAPHLTTEQQARLVWAARAVSQSDPAARIQGIQEAMEHLGPVEQATLYNGMRQFFGHPNMTAEERRLWLEMADSADVSLNAGTVGGLWNDLFDPEKRDELLQQVKEGKIRPLAPGKGTIRMQFDVSASPLTGFETSTPKGLYVSIATRVILPPGNDNAQAWAKVVSEVQSKLPEWLWTEGVRNVPAEDFARVRRPAKKAWGSMQGKIEMTLTALYRKHRGNGNIRIELDIAKNEVLQYLPVSVWTQLGLAYIDQFMLVLEAIHGGSKAAYYWAFGGGPSKKKGALERTGDAIASGAETFATWAPWMVGGAFVAWIYSMVRR